MTAHVAIRRESYVAGTRERPEVGVFTQTHTSRPPVPWGRIAVGDPVWMKWSGGPIVARARVQGQRQIEGCTAEKLRPATAGYKLYDLEDYWRSLAVKPTFFVVVVYLDQERWRDQVFTPKARSRGESWVVLDRPELEEAWVSARPDKPEPGELTSPANRRAGRGSRTIPASLRFQVFRRDNFTCQYCGRRAPEVVLHADHVQPWIAEGPTSLDNLRTACSDCNLGKGARRLTAAHS